MSQLMIPRIEIQEISPAFFEDLKNRSGKASRSINGLGFTISGHVEAICKDAESQEVAWTIDQDNLITDYGRRLWFQSCFSTALQVATSPSAETPVASRYTLPDNGATSSSQTSTAQTPSNNASTNTKTIAFSFSTPSSNRTIGSIGLAAITTNWGFSRILCYSLITPIKTQLTTQTLEVSYRLTMTPVA